MYCGRRGGYGEVWMGVRRGGGGRKEDKGEKEGKYFEEFDVI